MRAFYATKPIARWRGTVLRNELRQRRGGFAVFYATKPIWEPGGEEKAIFAEQNGSRVGFYGAKPFVRQHRAFTKPLQVASCDFVRKTPGCAAIRSGGRRVRNSSLAGLGWQSDRFRGVDEHDRLGLRNAADVDDSGNCKRSGGKGVFGAMDQRGDGTLP